MASAVALETVDNKMVGMGQIALARAPIRLSAVLGSCVGVVLHHARLGLGALGHVVLPQASGRSPCSGKFADLAIPEMLRQLELFGAHRVGVVAKIAGGACMFGSGGPLNIGQNNVEAVTRALLAAGIRVVNEDVGGSKGRRVRFDPSSGKVVVEIVGCPPRTL